jgi:hypothetical protein
LYDPTDSPRERGKTPRQEAVSLSRVTVVRVRVADLDNHAYTVLIVTAALPRRNVCPQTLSATEGAVVTVSVPVAPA